MGLLACCRMRGFSVWFGNVFCEDNGCRLTRQGVGVSGDPADARRPCGLLARGQGRGWVGHWAPTQASGARFTQLGDGARRLADTLPQFEHGSSSFADTLPQFEHGSSSFADTLPQFEHGSSSFLAFWVRCTQFCLTVHADGTRYTQFFAGLEAMGTSSTCGFDTTRSFWGIKKCVYRTPVACSVGQNCVYRSPVACSVGQKLRAPYPGCVNRAPEACARPQRSPTSSSLRLRQQATQPRRASRTVVSESPRVSRTSTHANARRKSARQQVF